MEERVTGELGGGAVVGCGGAIQKTPINTKDTKQLKGIPLSSVFLCVLCGSQHPGRGCGGAIQKTPITTKDTKQHKGIPVSSVFLCVLCGSQHLRCVLREIRHNRLCAGATDRR